MTELLDELVSMVAADERFKDIELHRDYNFDLEWHCDRGQLSQALWNLLVNGAEAMEHGGRLTCGIDSETPAVFIEDTGPGIPDAIRDKVFDPFFTTKDSGTGLGLATVHSIVEAHHGRLDLVKVAGGGERFIICMPSQDEVKLGQAV